MSTGTITAERQLPTVKAAPVFADCCERTAACRMYLLHGGHVIDANFHQSTGCRVVLRVADTQADDLLQLEALCCVAFPGPHLMYAFLASIKQIKNINSTIEIHFDQPTTLSATNLRHSYRVPVLGESIIELVLSLSDGTRLTGEVSNVSEAGVEVNLPSDDTRIPIDAEVRCELSYREDRVSLPAVVRHRHHSRRGLQFSLARTPESRQTVLTLQRIVRSLEQSWLKNRLS